MSAWRKTRKPTVEKQSRKLPRSVRCQKEVRQLFSAPPNEFRVDVRPRVIRPWTRFRTVVSHLYSCSVRKNVRCFWCVATGYFGIWPH